MDDYECRWLWGFGAEPISIKTKVENKNFSIDENGLNYDLHITHKIIPKAYPKNIEVKIGFISPVDLSNLSDNFPQ